MDGNSYQTFSRKLLNNSALDWRDNCLFRSRSGTEFFRGTTQGIVKCLNNKLKLIKRKAYRFRNFCNFELRSQLSMIFSD
ncbi:transposase [Baaleninema simplex]|uniref:transposase n=1 Tax=Baaleninema simplex TaxID=2862350 RepID=UPI0008FBCAE8